MNSVLNWRLPDSSIVSLIMNGMLFNISWFVIVSTHSSMLAPLVVVGHLLVHFSLLGRGAPELVFITAVTLFGLALDQVLFYLGVFTVSGQPSLAPVWLSCLWPVLATTCMHAFSGLARRPWLAAAFGGVGGAGSYLAGTALSTVQFGSDAQGPWIMGGLWVILFPVLLMMAQRCLSLWEEQNES